MANIIGTIRSAGEGMRGLRIFAYEEVRIGIDDPPKPCRSSHPTIKKVGETTTDSTGSLRISFTPTEPFKDACSFSAVVYIRVLDGETLVWISPKKSITPTIRFDHDVVPENPPDNAGEAIVIGALTTCGHPAVGFQVVAYEVVRIGLNDPPKPCRIGHPNIRNLGAVTTGEDGKFHIPFTPSPEIPDACSFSANVYVDVFDAATRVWQSPQRSVAAIIRFDRELISDCPPGSSLVRVVDDAGRRAPGAEVLVNGVSRGLTDELGQLAVQDLSAGDTLAARLRVLENETSREAHDIDSRRNWNYRIYRTSVPVQHDANGDNVQLPLFQVVDHAAIQELRVSRNNTLVGLNLRVSIEWDATREQLGYFRDRLLETSQLIYNATDGQFLIEHLEISDNGSFWDEADIRIFANWNQASNASIDGFFGSSGYIRMNPYDSLFPGTYMHEMGHFAFGPRDEYEPGDNWDPDNGPPRCTLASSDSGSPFGDGNEKDSCLMRGARYKSRKKFCSAHRANPHVDGTEQGAQDCWSEILERYGGGGWRLLSPAGRGAIVSRLPDSGLPLGLDTDPPPPADQAGSYIPVIGWRPEFNTRNRVRAGECANLIARAVESGSGVNSVDITLSTADGRRIYQGKTEDKNLPDGVSTSEGEITLRGAHIGDTISARKIVGLLPIPVLLIGSVEITDCTSPVIIPLSRLPLPLDIQTEPLASGGLAVQAKSSEQTAVIRPVVSVLMDDEEAAQVLLFQQASGGGMAAALTDLASDHETNLQITVFDAAGNPFEIYTTIVSRSVPVEVEVEMYSADGQLEIVIPPGGIAAPAQLMIEEVLGGHYPAVLEGERLLVGPYRIQSTVGEILRHKSWLFFHPGGVFPAGEKDRVVGGNTEVLVYDMEKAKWEVLPSDRSEEPFLVSASIERLGIYTLVERKAGA